MADDKQNSEGTLKKAIHGGKWVLLNTLFQRTISLASFFILARLLLPKDFGIISLLFVAPNLLDLVTTMGFETTLIQSKEEPQKYFNEIWTLNILKSIVISIVIFFSAPLIADFFHLENAIWAVRLSGLFILITAYSNVAQVYFFKDIDFKKIFIRDAVGSITYAAVSIPLALFYKSFWPLFFGNIGQDLTSTLATYVLHEYRPRLSLGFKKLKSLLGYSKWIFGQNLVTNSISMVENGLIGKLIDATSVGLYTRAKSLAVLPSAPISNLNKVTYPAYSKIQDASEKISEGFLKSLDLLFFLTVPFSLLFLEAGHRLILIFLGEKWIELDTLLKILIFAVTINTLATITGPIFNAIGKPKIQFRISLINIITLIFFLTLFAAFYGVIGAGIGVLISSLIVFLASFYKLIKIMNIKIFAIMKTLIIPLLSSFIALGIGNLVFVLVGEKLGNVAFIMLIGFLGMFYLILITLSGTLLKTGPYTTLKLILFQIIKK